MKQGKIKAIIDKRMSEVGKLSGKIADSFDADAIHDFRTSVKSLRAFMRMLAATQGDKFKVPKRFKKLYHTVGNIRGAQLELEKLKTAKLQLPLYKSHLEEIVKAETKSWKDTEKAVAKLEARVKEFSDEKLRSSDLRHFVKDQLLGIHNLCVSQQMTDDMVHSMRKLLKDAIYVIKSVKKESPEIVDDLDVDMDQLNHCSQLLGDYNDARIMLGRMHDFIATCNDAAEKQRISAVWDDNVPKLQSERKGIIKEMLVLTRPHVTTGSQTETEPQELILDR